MSMVDAVPKGKIPVKELIADEAVEAAKESAQELGYAKYKPSVYFSSTKLKCPARKKKRKAFFKGVKTKKKKSLRRKT